MTFEVYDESGVESWCNVQSVLFYFVLYDLKYYMCTVWTTIFYVASIDHIMNSLAVSMVENEMFNIEPRKQTKIQAWWKRNCLDKTGTGHGEKLVVCLASVATFGS